MTETILRSAFKEVTLGFDKPFCVIGERINPTGRKLLAEEMSNEEFARVRSDAIAQVKAGAMMLDVNAGIPLTDEPKLLAAVIKVVQSVTDVPLVIDSSIIGALEAGLKVYEGRALVNSVTGEEESLETVLPLVKEFDAAVVAISNDETGISEDPDKRFEVAKKILQRAQDHGLRVADVVVDPLVMPIGALNFSGASALKLIRRLREELHVNTICGASNVSFGLPNRHSLNASFLSMGIGAGLTSAIMNPLHIEEMDAVRGANVIAGKDPECRNWIARYREPIAGNNSKSLSRKRKRRPKAKGLPQYD